MLSNWINALENVNYIRHHHQKSQNAPQIAFGKHAQNNTVSTHRGIGKRLSWVNGWCIPRKGTRKEDTQERERAKKRDRRKRQKVNVVNKHIRINAPKDLKTARSCRKQPSLWMFAYAWHLFFPLHRQMKCVAEELCLLVFRSNSNIPMDSEQHCSPTAKSGYLHSVCCYFSLLDSENRIRTDFFFAQKQPKISVISFA